MDESTELYPYCKTDRQRQYLNVLGQCDGNKHEAARRLGISPRKFAAGMARIRSNACCDPVTVRAGYDREAARERVQALKERIKGGSSLFVVTSAQDTTGPFRPFFESLKVYCDSRGAELIIIPVHYKNVSLYTAGQEYKKAWHPDIEPYLIDQRVSLGGLDVMANIKVAATAANPLSDLDSIGGGRWTIFGHSQMAMEPVPTAGSKRPKRMYTTGSVTQKNYSETKYGAKAEFHHVFGALVVELDGRRVFIRQLNADSTGGFYDLDKHYTAEGVTEGHRPASLTTGDEHVKWMRPSVKRATYTDEDSIVKTLRPEVIVRHDVIDAYAVSHHHLNDPLTQYKKHHKGDNCARSELDQCVDFINATTPDDSETWIVASNHHDHIDKWLARASANADHHNADLILELQAKQRQAIRDGTDIRAFPIYLGERLTCKYRILDRNTPAMIKGVDHSQHGDVGTGGSKGSARALSKAAHKMTLGHSHVARIVKSVYQAASSAGELEYYKGLGAHTNTHVLQYPNGKRTLIDIFNGRWRG